MTGTVVNPNRVTFSGKTKIRVGPYGTPVAALTTLGLIAQGATLNANQTFRSKKDNFPEVTVAEAIQAQEGQMQTTLREWGKDTLLPALGLYAADITEAAGGDTVITDEIVIFNAAGVAVLTRKAKASVAPVVRSQAGGAGTLYVAGTDYFLVPADVEGRSLLVRISTGAIPAQGSVYVTYTHTQVAYEEYPVGRVAQVRYWTVLLEEELTNGGKIEVFVPKARIGINGNLNFAAVENGAELPITVMALFDTTYDLLWRLRNYPA